MIIIPAIDLRSGRCVRLVQGRASEATVYDADPVETARAFAASGAKVLHVVDLDAAFGEADSGNAAVIERIVGAVGVPVEVGGGMRSVEAVRRMIERGASYAIVGTLAVREPATLAELVAEFGEKIVIGIDARAGQVMTHGWEAGSGIAATELAARVAQIGIARIIYTDVARDGMLAGVNLEQTASVARAASVRVTASGGIGSLADIERLVEFERTMIDESGGVIDSVIVGKALYENRFTFAEAAAIAKGEEK